MRTSFRDLLRLNEAAEQLEAPPEEKGRKAKTALELDQEEAESKFNSAVVSASQKSGGYVNPMSIPFSPEDLDRWENKAKLTGSNIATVRADEMNAAIDADKRQKREAARAAGIEKGNKKRLEFANQYNQTIDALGLSVSKFDVNAEPGKIKDPEDYDFALGETIANIKAERLDPTKMDPEDIAKYFKQTHEKRIQKEQKELDQTKISVEAALKKFGNVNFNEAGAGKLQLPSGQIVDLADLNERITALEPTVSDKNVGKFIGRDGQEKPLTLSVLDSKGMDKYRRELADIRQQKLEIDKYVAKLNADAQVEEIRRTKTSNRQSLPKPTIGSSSSSASATSNTTPQTTAVAAASPAGGIASKPGAGSVASPAGMSSSRSASASAPASAPAGANVGTGAPAAGGGVSPSDKFFRDNPIGRASQTSPKIEQLASIVEPNFLTTQQQLTRSVAEPTTETQSETNTNVIGKNKSKRKGAGDARYGVLKSTPKGIVAVAEAVRFNRGDLSGVLNEKINIGKTIQTVKNIGKNIGKVGLAGLKGYARMTNPADRFPVNLFQHGWSKEKGERQARYLYNNPTALAGALAPISAIAALGGKAGAAAGAVNAALLGGVNTLGAAASSIGLDSGSMLASSIPFGLSIVGDPRHANIDPAKLMKNTDKEQEN